ncbi:MAG: radical SAM protein [Firmicutes bacterium]|nr:radical SAM protein [Bacillota bacterium]
MRYVPPVFRPPSEADSLILQVTLGCSHNACTFCGSYKGKRFRVKDWPEIEAHIDEAKQYVPDTRRIFLADGNALVHSQEVLLKILNKLYRDFPSLERVGIYASPKDVLNKSREELAGLKAAGLGIVYLGLESGHDQILADIKKGATASQMIEAAKAVTGAGIKLSVTIIIGIGGPERSGDHARATASVLNAMKPDYIGALTLMVVKGTPLYKKMERGEFTILSPREMLQELRVLIENLSIEGCVFRSNHASNYLPLKGTLNRDKAGLLSLIDTALANEGLLRPEFMRGL